MIEQSRVPLILRRKRAYCVSCFPRFRFQKVDVMFSNIINGLCSQDITEGCHRAKKPDLNISRKYCITLLPSFMQTTRSKVSQSISSTLLAQMWLSSYTCWMAMNLTGDLCWMIPQCRAVVTGFSKSDSWTSSLPPERSRQQKYIL